MATKTQRSSATNLRNAQQNLSAAANSVIKSEPVQDAVEWARDYARKNPEAGALWCFGIGFILAWKI
jgi:hypothetical protein